MPKLQHEVRLDAKTLNRLANQRILESTPATNRDPVRPPVNVRVYTLDNPPPRLRDIRIDILKDAYSWAQGDWYLIDPTPQGAMVHNNRRMADVYRKSHNKNT